MILNKTLMKHILNNHNSIGNPYQPIILDFKMSRKKSAHQKFQDFCQMFVISKKKTIPYGMDFKIYRKSIA